MHDDSPMIAASPQWVFGRERLRMPTGEHVEVFREDARPGERLRYSKRFVPTLLGDFRPWTEREWQVLQRLAARGSAPVAQIASFAPATGDEPAQLQTFDAGVTVEQWTTLRASHPDRPEPRHVFEDCAHWWALAHHCLRVLDAIHEQGCVHLDFKADNLCVPWDIARSMQPATGEAKVLRFGELKLIDFAFSVFTGEEPPHPLPLGRHTKYDYQSPRLLDALGAGRRGLMAPTRDLDWRCDFFSLAAMLWLYLPELDERSASSWSAERHAQAGVLVRRLLDDHHANPGAQRPHKELIALTQVLLNQADLAASLRRGWTFAAREDAGGDAWSTPLTRITGTARPSPTAGASVRHPGAADPPIITAEVELPPRLRQRPPRRVPVAKVAGAVLGAAALVALLWTIEGPPVPGGGTTATDAPALAQAPSTSADDADPSRPGRPSSPPPASLPSPSPSDTSAGSFPPQAMSDVPAAGPVPPGSAPAFPGTPPAAPADVPPAQSSSTNPSAAPLPGGALQDLPGQEVPRATARSPEPAPPAAVLDPAPARPAPGLESPPVGARTPAPAPAPAPAPTPSPAPSVRAEADADAEAVGSEALDAQARALLGVPIAQIAAWADRQLASVLRLAERTDMLPRREELRGAVAAARLAPGRPELKLTVRAQEARRLNEAARIAYWDRNDVQEAASLQARAFAANPLDSEVAGNLAFLRMRQQPPQIRAARQLALHSLTLPDVRYPLGRVQDWTTLAISSALLGRESDARHAWYISLVLAPDRQRQRNAALRAVSIYGERLRPSVEAMLRREFPADRRSSAPGPFRSAA